MVSSHYILGVLEVIVLPLRQHQVEGLAFAKDKFREHLVGISESLRKQDGLAPDAYKYQKQDAERALTEALAGAGIMLAWEMGLGKTATGIRLHHLLPHWADEWQAEGWLHPLVYKKLHGPTLVVCPNTIKGVWEDEFIKWTDEEHGEGSPRVQMFILDSKKDDFKMGLAFLKAGITKFMVMSYDTMRVRLEDGLLGIQWGLVIYDEIQSVINPTAQRTQAAYQIDCLLRVGLSGTPFTNKPDRLHGALTLLQGFSIPVRDGMGEVEHWIRRSPVWGSFESYARAYVRMGSYNRAIGGMNLTHEKSWLSECRYNPNGHDDCMALHPRMQRHLMHRKRLEECVDLPPMSIVDVAVDLTDTQEKLYNRLLSGVMSWLNDDAYQDGQGRTNIANVLSQMTYAFELVADARQLGMSIANRRIREGGLNIVDYAGFKEQMFRQVAADETSAKLNWLKEALENDIDGKLLVFTEYAENARLLAEDLREYGVALMTGQETAVYERSYRTPYRERQDLVRAFQSDERTRVFVGTSAAFEGITLTAANYVVLYGKVDWTPGRVYQAIARARRIGQDKPVTVFRLYSPKTIEVWLNKVLSKKQADMDAALDNDTIDRHSALNLGGPGDIINAFRGIG